MTPETAKLFLGYAPKIAECNPDIRGYWMEDGYYVCAQCVSRMMARGCSIGNATPVWKDAPEPYGVCVGCEK